MCVKRFRTIVSKVAPGFQKGGTERERETDRRTDMTERQVMSCRVGLDWHNLAHKHTAYKHSVTHACYVCMRVPFPNIREGKMSKSKLRPQSPASNSLKNFEFSGLFRSMSTLNAWYHSKALPRCWKDIPLPTMWNLSSLFR